MDEYKKAEIAYEKLKNSKLGTLFDLSGQLRNKEVEIVGYGTSWSGTLQEIYEVKDTIVFQLLSDNNNFFYIPLESVEVIYV